MSGTTDLRPAESSTSWETDGQGTAPSVETSGGAGADGGRIAHSTDATDFDDLVQRADVALFHAKDAGRDRICLDGHATPVVGGLSALA